MISVRLALAIFVSFAFNPGVASTVSPKDAPTLLRGTGFSITQNGYIVTSAQLVDAQPLITVRRPTESIKRRARLVAIDRKLDLALLKIDAQTVEIPIGNWDGAMGGQNVALLGFSSLTSLGESLNIISGTINLTASTSSNDSIFSVNQIGQSVSSGGPVLSMRGSVVGIVYGFSLEMNNLTRPLDQEIYAVNGTQLKRFLDRQQVKYVTETGTQTPVQAPELLRRHEGSIFIVEAGGDELTGSKKKSVRKGRVTGGDTTELPDKLRAMLKFIPEREQPRLFGAYKAGFDLIDEWDDAYVLVKSKSKKSEINSEIIGFDSIISYKRERTLSSGEPYLSVIMTARFNCVALKIDIVRQEFKPEAFGSGKSIVAKKKAAETQSQWAPIKSDRRRDSIKSAVCDDQSNALKNDPK